MRNSIAFVKMISIPFFEIEVMGNLRLFTMTG